MTMTSRDQHGFAAISAIFLVVVLAALGGFMLTFSNTQQLSSAQDVQGSRAYWAARAGLEWGLANVTSNSASCSSSQTHLVVEGFAVTVTCTRTTYSDGGESNVIIFRLISLASQGSGVATVERSLSASVEL